MKLRESLKKLLAKVPTNLKKEDVCILILGETGTGKEVLAEAIHHKLQREGEFVHVNCNNIQATLFESELFGYEKGAFTGAERCKRGLVEDANGGTLFLDEIGNIPMEIQSKLLRLVERKTFRRVGANKERKVEFLLISATNKNLLELVEKGKFREDLFYRISNIILQISSLRENKEEIRELMADFLEGKNLKFTKEALEFILCYPWYGNVRELKNFCKYLELISNDGEKIDISHLPEYMVRRWCPDERKKRKTSIKDKLKCMKKQWMKIMILEYLENGGDLEGLCKELGVKKRQLYNILRDLNIKINSIN